MSNQAKRPFLLLCLCCILTHELRVLYNSFVRRRVHCWDGVFIFMLFCCCCRFVFKLVRCAEELRGVLRVQWSFDTNEDVKLSIPKAPTPPPCP